MNSILIFIYLLSLTCWIGSIVFFSFFAAPAIFKNLERAEAGKIVGVIFPKYYMLGYICGSVILITLATQGSGVPRTQLGLSILMLVCSLLAGFGVGPNARKIKERLNDSIGAEEREYLERKFSRLHKLSVQLNATTLFAGLILLWFTAEGFAS